jgi:cytochrome c peroxidase
VALDTRGQAVGDPEGLAFSPDGAWLALAGSGTHELLFLPAAALPWTAGDPGDFIKPELAAVVHRVPVGGRPLAVAWRSAAEVVTANALADAVQAVDARHFRPGRAVALGGQEPDAARRGEALFYDATRAHHQWFSCHTCHVEGHTCGQNFDTLNDASYGNPKLTPTLRGVAHTGPWTWHGWQTDLAAGVRKSFADTLHGPTPSNAEVAAVVAYLETLRHPPPPTGDPEAVRRGEALFRGKARCARCHQGDNYTSPRVYDVGLEPDGSPYAKWNPPSLLGLADRGPYLHDGRAQTLEDVIANHHGPEKLEGVGLTAAERADLVAFLRTR